MMSIGKKSSLGSILAGIALSIAAGSAFADRPEWVERGKYRQAQEYR